MQSSGSFIAEVYLLLTKSVSSRNVYCKVLFPLTFHYIYDLSKSTKNGNVILSLGISATQRQDQVRENIQQTVGIEWT